VSRGVTHYWFPFGRETKADVARPVVCSHVAVYAPTANLTPEAFAAGLHRPLHATLDGTAIFAPDTRRWVVSPRGMALAKPLVIPAGAVVAVEGDPVEDAGWLLVFTETVGW
jgi:hypothetical protein